MHLWEHLDWKNGIKANECHQMHIAHAFTIAYDHYHSRLNILYNTPFICTSHSILWCNVSTIDSNRVLEKAFQANGIHNETERGVYSWHRHEVRERERESERWWKRKWKRNGKRQKDRKENRNTIKKPSFIYDYAKSFCNRCTEKKNVLFAISKLSANPDFPNGELHSISSVH